MSSTGLERQLVWTVIPAGRVAPAAGGSEPMAVFAVLLTPRLIGPGGSRLAVADFGMQRWPERLTGLRFDVFRARTPVPFSRVPYTALDGTVVQFSLAEQLATWQALFPAGMLVEPYQPVSYDGRDTRVFPASEAGKDIHGIYTATARAHAAHALATPESDAELRVALSEITALWQTGLLPSGVEPDRAVEDQPALARAYAFYRRSRAEFSPPQRRSAPPESEFHDTVAHLTDHPVVLRALGLLVDLAVPASRLGGSDPAELRVVPRWPNPDSNPPPGWTGATQTDLSPSTAYTLDRSRFLPASVDGPTSTGFSRGMLPLNGTGLVPSGNGRFEVAPFDVDGAALRLVSTSQSDSASVAQSGAGPVQAGALPVLHSMGFALVDRGRQTEHDKQLQRARQRATASGLLSSALLADSLLGGYRLDVFDDTSKTWHSLCRRRVHYTIGGAPLGPNSLAGLPDEGYIRPGAAATGAGAADMLYVHQTVARWDGWSLVAQRPERTVTTGDTLPVPVATALGAVVTCEPGSLPRLRFGRTYRLRVRIADLAGGGLRADEVGVDEEQTNELTYRRYEPLPPPELVPTHVFEDGAGQDRMVIRSDRGVTVDEYAAHHGYRAYDLRHFLPPKCSLDLAIQYDGAFDKAFGPAVSPADVTRLFAEAKRADRGLTDTPGAQTVGIDPATAPSPYVILPETDAVLPWLADPSGAFIAMNARPRPTGPTGEPGHIVPPREHPVVAVWQGNWPDIQTASVKLEAAAAGCTVKNLDRRHLSVQLGPAEQVTFDIPSCMPYKHVQFFGIALWLGVDPQNPDTFQDVVLGRNRLITPPRTVTMVHAVQRPLSDPSGYLTAQRKSGDNDAVLGTDGLAIDIPSTGRIDLHAEWTDQDDSPPAPPTPRKRMAHVGSYDVQHLPPREALPVIRQEFGDTRHHRVRYTVTAVSRFEDCFGRALATDPGACCVTGALADTDVPSSARPPAPKLLYAMPTFRWTRTVDGQRSLTRLRRGGGLRVFLERPWFVSGNDEALAVLVFPTAQAPPAALHYVATAGRDPVHGTGSPPGILTRAQVNAPKWVQVTLPELPQLLDAGLYPVELDDQADRRYADLDLSPVVASSYFPFVRLGLARYQPHTATDVSAVSKVVLTDPVQLPPDRRLTVTRNTGQASVILDGLGPGGAGNTVGIELQVQNAGTAAVSDIAGWSTVFATTAVLGQTASISIPNTQPRPQRLIVREFETSPVPATGDGTGRPVFLDVVPLGVW